MTWLVAAAAFYAGGLVFGLVTFLLVMQGLPARDWRHPAALASLISVIIWPVGLPYLLFYEKPGMRKDYVPRRR